MTATVILEIRCPDLTAEQGFGLVQRLRDDLNSATEIVADAVEQSATSVGGEAKGAGLVLGELALAALTSGTITAVIQVLRTYFDRGPTMEMELKRPDGGRLLLKGNARDLDAMEARTKAFLEG